VLLYDPSDAHAQVPEPSVAVPGLKSRLAELAKVFFSVAIEPAIIGVTGTNGKTTVAYLLAQALSRPQRSCAYIGTLGFGVPPKLTPHTLTTPDCLTLHRELAELATTRVAMEVSSHALAQDRIAGLKFHTAVFTNLTRDHLDEHGELASYGRAKARLFQLPGLTHAVVNANDPFAASLASGLANSTQLLRTSLGGVQPAELVGRIRQTGLEGIELDLTGRFGTARLVSKLIGDFNAENLLVALGTLLAGGMSLGVAAEALARARAAPGRMEVLGGPPDQPWVVIDYAHTPDALERTLTTLKSVTRGELRCVFGCGGERDRGKRPLMGAIAGRLADRVVLTDDNPRSEDPAQIVREILAGLSGHPQVSVTHERGAAIHAAIEQARPGDLVLIAGKGHESVQLIGGQTRTFSDRAVATEALGGRR
jgi:UDP-N-acetylmuramoyl-L-alanyl-D-glutamate--2,6-diaminopimelate ligase